MRSFVKAIVVMCILVGMTVPAMAKTSNGNDFALFYSEAKSDMERKMLHDDAKGRPHFFRYLQIVEMEKTSKGGRPYVNIVAFEPSSCLDVRFSVTKRVSLQKLWSEPASKVGDAIAVTGVVREINSSEIVLNPVIVKHKDRLSPARGKEFLYEVDPSATFYSYTGGDTAVSLTFEDRDLLKHKNSIIASKGNQGWTDFLIREKAKRDKARAAKAKKYIKAQMKEHK